MSIKMKMMLILAIPVCGLLVFSGVSLFKLRKISSDMHAATTNTFIPMLRQDLPEMGQLDLAIILLLNADRDAYQARIAEHEIPLNSDPATLAKIDAFNLENINQIIERTEQARKAMRKDGLILYDEFIKCFEIWKIHSRAVISSNLRIHAQRQQLLKQLQSRLDATAKPDNSLTQLIAAVKTGVPPDENTIAIHIGDSTFPAAALKDFFNTVRLRDRETALSQNTFDPMRDKLDKLGEHFEERIKHLVKSTGQRGEEASNHVDKMAGEIIIATRLFAAVGISLAILTLILGIACLEKISRPLRKAVAIANHIADGDLDLASRQLDGNNLARHSSDETAILIRAMKTMTDKLNELLAEVNRAAIDLVSTSTQITASSREQEATTNELRAATNQSACATRQIASTAAHLSSTMEQVAGATGNAARLAGEGGEGLLKMENSIEQLGGSTSAIAAKLAVINDKTGNISKVVGVITKVAEQINLLSLNASIEAEKAGEYGKGFSVVARETRRLSDQTAVAAEDIARMVQDMQDSVSSGVMGMEKFSEDVKLCVADSARISSQIEGVISEVRTLPDKFNMASEGMKQQAQGAKQINESMSQLNTCAANTSESVKSFNDVSRQLNQAALALQKELTRFKLAQGGS